MSAIAASQVFASIRSVGGLLPADMLARIAEGEDVSGSAPADYHAPGARSVRDAAGRHWDCLSGAWRALRDGRDPAGLATENWLLPLFEAHGFTPLRRQAPASGVSHRCRHVPVHLAAWDTGLDARPPGGGLPPRSMLQQYLNTSPDHLWGIASNGRQLCVLRASASPAGISSIDVDLAAMFDGDLFTEFVLLYRLLHVSRYEIPDGAAPAACRMERWRAEAAESGARTLDQLRDGVRDAVARLGTGFLRHPANARLRDDLDAGLLNRALLRLVYRLLFWFVAEDRDVLLVPGTDERIADRYRRHFSAARLRAAALRPVTSSDLDLWQAVRLVLNGLADENGLPQLGLPGLGGIYDHTGTDQVLHGLELSDEHLLAGVRSLAVVRDDPAGRYRLVDYRGLGAVELGSIYESLLELVPRWSEAERLFRLGAMPGNERKTTGSYYTPAPLIGRLLDTALEPVLDRACERAEAAAGDAGRPAAVARALLSVTVCDPACGSGHFLVAAARRIAKRLAAVREDNPEPGIEAMRTALRDVVGHCVYGVDINPMAVELARVSLWLEALEPGKPLGFLGTNVKCGNALIGATPALVAAGVPDDAFKPVEGDDPRWAALLRKANARERAGQERPAAADHASRQSNEMLAAQLTRITEAPAGSLREVHRQAAAYRALADSPRARRLRQVADAWCAAFVWRKAPDAPPAITQAAFAALRDSALPPAPAVATEIARLRAEFGFFHWHLEFPGVFRVPDPADPDPADPDPADPDTGWSGGFDCVLGNPPWERIKLAEQEFFAQRDEAIAAAPHADARKKLIAALPEANPGLHGAFRAAKRRAMREGHFLRASRRYRFTARGDINRYAVFAETGRMLIGPSGRAGVIVPTGIATDATTQYFFKDLVRSGSLASLHDFENARPVFRDVHRSYKFALLTLAGRAAREPRADFAFFLHQTADLDARGRRFALTPGEITLLNPNTGTCPVFRTRRDAEITLGIYRRIPVLVNGGDPGGNPWGISFTRMFDITNHAGLFRTREELEAGGWSLDGNVFTKGGDRMLPLYQGMMASFYDHRAADIVRSRTAGTRVNQPRYLTGSDKADPRRLAMPRYWVDARDTGALPGWMIGFSNVTSPTNDRTFVPYPLPRSAVGNSIPLISLADHRRRGPGFLALASSFCFDYVARQKTGGVNLNFFIVEQLPCLPPGRMDDVGTFVSSRVLELVYTACDMAPLARDLDDHGPPFRWDPERRFAIRAELDALFFRLYGIERDDVGYIMDTFPVTRERDLTRYGCYRTRDAILASYDSMADADARPYRTPITPPPGQGPRHQR